MAESRPAVRVPRRALVVVAGLPGAGKSTLLERMRAETAATALDSEQVRSKLGMLFPARIPYRWYRFAVHGAHRARIGWRCLASTGLVLVHEPSTRATTRAMLVVFGWLTRRRRVLVWLDVRPAVALEGQHRRGRLIRARSFRRHVRRAESLPRAIRGGHLGGWHAAHVFSRSELERGLCLRIVERRG